jgi:hypothetical protein
MFTIGEFGRLGDISIRMLRHYDEIGLLRPAQVDPVTGYRGYAIAPAQRLLAVEREIPGFGPDNIVPVLNPAYDELAGVVAAMGLDPDRVYLSCYDVSGADAAFRPGARGGAAAGRLAAAGQARGVRRCPE